MATNEPASGINAVSSMEKSLSSLGASKDVTLSGNHTDVDLTPKATIQTIGARGTSEKVYASANQLRKIAEQLKKEDADPGLVDLITRLANAGHTIGDTLTTAEQQADLNMPAINDAETNFGNVKSELDTYLKEHPNLLTSDQQQTIDLHAADISTSPATFMTNEVLATQDEDIRSSSPVSQSVHNSSNSICNNGGNSNSCTK